MIRYSGLGLVLSLVMAACVPGTSGTGQPTAPGGTSSPGPVDPRQTTLTVAFGQEPASFDPHVNTAAHSSYRYYPNVYETLLEIAPDGSFVPALAESWTISDDGKTYTFALRNDVKFSDGTQFNAESVRAGLDRLRSLNKGSVGLFSPIESVSVVDEFTVDMVLTQEYAPILAILAAWQGAIFGVSPTAVEENDAGGDLAEAWLRDHTAGTGPFMLESWTPDDRIVLVRNPHYREAVAPDAIQRIVYLNVPEPGTRRQMIAAGDVDLVEEVAPSLIDPLRQADRVEVNIDVTHGTGFGFEMMFNLQKEPFNDVHFRRAVAYAINYERLITLFEGTGVQMQGPFPETFTPWFSAEHAVRYSQDLDRAREELREAGYSAPIDPPVQVRVNYQAAVTLQRDMLTLIAEDLAQIGIELEIIATEQPVWREEIWSHTFEMVFLIQPLRYPDPDSFFSLQVVSTEYRHGGFNPGILSDEIDDLIFRGRATTDLAERQDIYNELQRIVTEDALLLFLVTKRHAWAHRDNVTGIEWNPHYGTYFWVHEIKKLPQ